MSISGPNEDDVVCKTTYYYRDDYTEVEFHQFDMAMETSSLSAYDWGGEPKDADRLVLTQSRHNRMTDLCLEVSFLISYVCAAKFPFHTVELGRKNWPLNLKGTEEEFSELYKLCLDKLQHVRNLTLGWHTTNNDVISKSSQFHIRLVNGLKNLEQVTCSVAGDVAGESACLVRALLQKPLRLLFANRMSKNDIRHLLSAPESFAVRKLFLQISSWPGVDKLVMKCPNLDYLALKFGSEAEPLIAGILKNIRLHEKLKNIDLKPWYCTLSKVSKEGVLQYQVENSSCAVVLSESLIESSVHGRRARFFRQLRHWEMINLLSTMPSVIGRMDRNHRCESTEELSLIVNAINDNQNELEQHKYKVSALDLIYHFVRNSPHIFKQDRMDRPGPNKASTHASEGAEKECCAFMKKAEKRRKLDVCSELLRCF